MSDRSGAPQRGDDSRKRKRDDMEGDEDGAADASPDDDGAPASKRSKTAEPSTQAEAGAGSAAADAAKQARLAAILAKKQQLQQKKASLQKQISDEDKAIQEKERLDQTEQELRQRALQKFQAHVQQQPPPPAAGRGAAPALPPPPKPIVPVPAAVASIFDLESIPKYQSTLKANVRFQQEAAEKAVKKEKPVPEKPVQKIEAPNRPHPADRKRRPLQFNEPGTWVRRAEEQRNFLAAQAQFGLKNQQNVQGAGSQGGIGPADATPDQLKKASLIEDTTPLVEWWDKPFLDHEDYEVVDESIITNLIDHPVLLEPAAEKPPPGPLPLMLTPAERKRLRKKLRAERLKEKQDRIMLGIEPAPKPRIRLANMMRVMGSEAIQDPTRAEKMVRKESEERVKRHEQRNAERKLTPEERREKLLKKFQEDTKLKSSVAVFRIESLASGKHRFKVEMNAQQYHATGTIVNGPKFSLVVVEGGPKGIKKITKLMTRRIKWDEKDDGSEFVIESTGKKNSCALIWTGEVLKAAFQGFRMHQAESDAAAKQFLQKSGVGHYWDMATTFDDKEAHS